MPPMIDYAQHTGPDGTQDNIGGLTNNWWYAPFSYFATNGIKDVKALDDASVTQESEWAEISDDHEFTAPDQRFAKMYCTLDKGSVDATVQGDTDGRSFKFEFKGFYPGVDTAVLGFFRRAKNDRFIVLAELADGQIIQVGSKRFCAYIIANKIGTATNSQGTRGTEFIITSMESGPMIYTGAILESNPLS